MELSISVIFQQLFPAKMTTRRWQQLERVELLCREKTSRTRGSTRSKCEQHAFGIGHDTLGCWLVTWNTIFFWPASSFVLRVNRASKDERLRHVTTFYRNTNRYKGFVTMYFRSLWTNLPLSMTLCSSVNLCAFCSKMSFDSLHVDRFLIHDTWKYNNYNYFTSIIICMLCILFYSVLLIC